MKKIAYDIRHSGTWMLVAALYCLVGPRAGAAAPYAELAAGAALIVVGTVDTTVLQEPEDPYGNWQANVRVVEWLKGRTAEQIHICYPGENTGGTARSLARAEGITPYRLDAGARYLFFLAGGSPYRLAHLTDGILPAPVLPAVRTALLTIPLTVSIATGQDRVRPGDVLLVTVTLRNTSAAPVSIRLPRAWGESCRFWSWRAGADGEGNPLAGSPPAADPSGYILVTLPPGATRVSVHRLQVAPRGRVAAEMPVYLAAGVYYLTPDALRTQCLAAPPVSVLLQPPLRR